MDETFDKENSCPLATVVMPVYNSPDLFASIDSVLEQDYPRIEFLILDDCSKNFNVPEIERYISLNNRGNIIDFYVDKHAENVGTVRTMNQLLRMSRGEYIFTLACDDLFYDSRVITDWVCEFERTGARFITSKRECFDDRLDESYGIKPEKKYIRWINYLPPRQLFLKMIPCNHIFGCCTARKCETLDEYGLIDEQYKLIDDYHYFMSVLRKGEKIHFFNRVTIKYRGGGISSKKNISDEYIMESDLIMNNEIYPYIKRVKKAKKLYEHWKADMTGLTKYELLQQKWQNNRFALDIIFLRFNLGKLVADPQYAIKIFKKRFVKNYDG